ncbi:hypothetical protein V6Z12_A05G052000 [Gossypium hirsutum]
MIRSLSCKVDQSNLIPLAAAMGLCEEEKMPVSL